MRLDILCKGCGEARSAALERRMCNVTKVNVHIAIFPQIRIIIGVLIHDIKGRIADC